MCSCIQTGNVFQGGGLKDVCHRRRNRLKTCPKKHRNVDEKKSVFFSAVGLEKKRYVVRDSAKDTRTYEYRSSMKEQEKK